LRKLPKKVRVLMKSTGLYSVGAMEPGLGFLDGERPLDA